MRSLGILLRLLRIIVASSPSPNPSCASPLDHPESLKPGARQAVPWLEPSSRYFQEEPNRMSAELTGSLIIACAEPVIWLPTGLLNHYGPEPDIFRPGETVEILLESLTLQDWNNLWSTTRSSAAKATVQAAPMANPTAASASASI